MWEVLLIAGGVDLSRRAEPQMLSVSLHDDNMLSYDILNTIWVWNCLEERCGGSADELDVEVACSLVRFLDLAAGIDYYTDILKRCEEAIGNMLVAFPDLAAVMADEANSRFFAENLDDSLRRFERHAEES